MKDDAECYLEAAYKDFNDFLKVCKIQDDNYSVNIAYK